jgi:hypothetical protein
MPVQNALASVRLDYAQKTSGAPYHVSLQVWNRSFDNPDPTRRSSIIREVSLTQLPDANWQVSNLRIRDRYGVDHTRLWAGTGGYHEQGWDGYVEWDRGAPDHLVIWSVFSGIYDERCAADTACDGMRLQTLRTSNEQITVFNYLLGPVSFSFDITMSAPPKAVKLKTSLIGGNGGNPAVRGNASAWEEFVVQFP